MLSFLKQVCIYCKSTTGLKFLWTYCKFEITYIGKFTHTQVLFFTRNGDDLFFFQNNYAYFNCWELYTSSLLFFIRSLVYMRLNRLLVSLNLQIQGQKPNKGLSDLFENLRGDIEIDLINNFTPNQFCPKCNGFRDISQNRFTFYFNVFFSHGGHLIWLARSLDTFLKCIYIMVYI